MSRRGIQYEYLWPLHRSVCTPTTTLSKITNFEFLLSVSECRRLSGNPEVIAAWPTSSVHSIFWSSTLHKVSKASGHHEQPTQMPRTRACVRSKPGKMLWSKHTVKDQCQVRSSWLLDADGTQVAARLAAVLVDRHIVLEELEPVGRL